MTHGLLMALLLAAAPQAATFNVSGTVVREDKQDPATVAQANQILISGSSGMVTRIGAGGAFEFSNVRPGTYQVIIGPRIMTFPVTVAVTDKDVTGVRAVIPLTVD